MEDLEPNMRGEAYEQAMALREDALWSREPVMPAGTVLEFGLSGSNLLVIDGKPDTVWPARLFTRWFAHAAFKQWISHVSRGYWVHHEFEEENSGC
ncbi:MAG: hypothetical protein IPL99_15630 [Candidatus Competibacteraceae bacterium]|nr:hypothetical protein [Candidatus Competibacteraceae bacterium]